MTRFAGQVAVVTGGAQGIGGATARRLAAEGASVLIADVDGEVGAQNVARIRAAGGVAELVVGDVAQPAALRGAIDAAAERWGKLTILVNNAYGGGPGIEGSAVEVEEDAWDRGMAILVKALYLGAKYAVPLMEQAGGGAIVNIASVHGLLAVRRRLVYDTGKAAVIGLTRQLAVDFGPLGVRVNAICPGLIITERGQERFEGNPARAAFFAEQYPVRRVGRPDDIAGAVAFLCSEDASFITGQSLAVDGGMTVQLQEDFGVRQGQYAQEHPELTVGY
jgi:NAD(P)-dependent dehydrogenase (short-subunit alcohol dehydrogenase family)